MTPETLKSLEAVLRQNDHWLLAVNLYREKHAVVGEATEEERSQMWASVAKDMGYTHSDATGWSRAVKPVRNTKPADMVFGNTQKPKKPKAKEAMIADSAKGNDPAYMAATAGWKDIEWVAGSLSDPLVKPPYPSAPSKAAVGLLEWVKLNEVNKSKFWGEIYSKGLKPSHEDGGVFTRERRIHGDLDRVAKELGRKPPQGFALEHFDAAEDPQGGPEGPETSE